VARTKTTETSSITAAQLADGDLIPVIDVSDTTMSSTGTNKKLAKSQLAEAAGVTAHLALGTDAHDAAAISYAGGTGISATDVESAIDELATEKLDKVTSQSAESTAVRLLQVNPKTASGFAPFEVIYNSFANAGAGAGTYNHAVHFGINASRHGDSANATANAPSVYMGIEDSYYDADSDLTYGAEFYTGYITPDGSTIPVGGLRPFYWRVKTSNTNTADKGVIINMDIGSASGGSAGSLNVWGSVVSGDQILGITPTQVLFFVPVNTPVGVGMQCGGTMTVVQNLTSPKATVGWINHNNTITVDTSADRVAIGVISTSLPSSSNGAYVGWATGIAGVSAGDMLLVPRTSNPSKVRLYGSTGGSAYEGLQVGASGSAPTLGFFGTAAVAKPTGVAVSAAGIHAALVSLWLIAA